MNSTIEEIEVAIEQLPRDELVKLANWISSRFANEWDKQIKEDIEAGRLIDLVQECSDPSLRGNGMIPLRLMESRACTSFLEELRPFSEGYSKGGT